MNIRKAFSAWVGIAVSAACLLGGFAILSGNESRENALKVAEQFGQVEFRAPLNKRHGLYEYPFIYLRGQQAFDEVIPVLKDVPDLYTLWLGGRRSKLTKEQLAEVGTLMPLERLTIQDCGIGDEDLCHLSGLKNLRELDLTRCKITDSGLKHLAKLENLESLDLRQTTISGQGLKYLPSRLTTLSLSGTLVDDTSVGYCTHFERVHTLEFDDTKVTEDGLMKLTGLHWLSTINVPDDIPREALRRFRAAYQTSIDEAVAAGEKVPSWRLGSYE